MRKTYVNLGCGSRFHPEWTNIDIAPVDARVRRHDLSRGIPLADGSCDAVYHSHLLEHLRPMDAGTFMRECARVLRPGGVIRVVVPDLERIARTYVAKIDEMDRGRTEARADLEWMRIEMYDQTVRESSGGKMAQWLCRDRLPNRAFVYERIGEELNAIVESRNRPPGRPTLGRILLFAARMVRRAIIGVIGGRHSMRAFDIGTFRLSGEVHQWMYDRHSLADLLRASGFEQPVIQTAVSSQIDDWQRYHLDTLDDGTAIKPDSLFMEARRSRRSSVYE